MSGRDEEDNPPEKPWLWIGVEMGGRMASTGGEKVSKMKIKTNVELGNTPSSSPGVQRKANHWELQLSGILTGVYMIAL